MKIILGLMFAVLWGSAATVGKFGFSAADPLVIFLWRFLTAGSILVTYCHVVKREAWPSRAEFKAIAFFGLLNTTLYLGLFAVALKHIAAGIATLSVALNPLLIATFSSLKARRPVSPSKWTGIFIGIIGVGVAVFRIMNTVHADVFGIILLSASMIAYSFAAVYFSGRRWQISTLSANGWQAFLGGIMFIPLTLSFQTMPTYLNTTFFGVLFWLVFPVSIASIQIWLYLVKKDPVSASLWLFLCPIVGFGLSSLMLGEPFTGWTAIGTLIVILALFIGRKD